MIEQNILNTIDGWYFLKKEIEECLSNGHMLNPSIDLSNRCNLNCPYCYVEDKDSNRKIKKNDELTFEEIINLIDDLADCGAKTINIVGAGEPTIDPDFEEIIEYIFKKKIKTVLFTNGIRISNEQYLAKFLSKNDVSIVVKYNSINAKIQDLFVGKDGYTIKRDKTIDMLIDLGFTSHEPTKLGIDVIVSKGNYNEIPQLLRWCRKNNIFPIMGGYIPCGRTINGFFSGYKSIENLSIKNQKLIISLLKPIDLNEKRVLIEKLRIIDEKYNIPYPVKPAYYCGGICTQTLGVYITIKGEIYPCVAKEIIKNNEFKPGLLGNIKDGDKVSIIWKNNLYLQEVRKYFKGNCIYK
jgi:MoaA/NifB/PqqE/SkfB family radical SAM enzyme